MRTKYCLCCVGVLAGQVALKNNVNLKDCLDYVRDARAKGLTAPVILMGYLNPFLAYGLDKLMKEAQEAGERVGRSMLLPPVNPCFFCSRIIYVTSPDIPLLPRCGARTANPLKSVFPIIVPLRCKTINNSTRPLRVPLSNILAPCLALALLFFFLVAYALTLNICCRTEVTPHGSSFFFSARQPSKYLRLAEHPTALRASCKQCLPGW